MFLEQQIMISEGSAVVMLKITEMIYIQKTVICNCNNI